MLLFWKCILYNTGSAELPVLRTSHVTCDGPICVLWWGFHEILPWCLVVPKVFCWIQKFHLSLRALKYFSCFLNTWACSTWYVLALVFCSIGTLVTACQFYLDLRQNYSSMSWYTSLPHLFCACQVVPIGSLYGFFCQSFLMLYESHYQASGFWVETLFLLGNCIFCIGIS